MKTSKKQNTLDIKRGITFPLNYAMYCIRIGFDVENVSAELNIAVTKSCSKKTKFMFGLF